MLLFAALAQAAPIGQCERIGMGDVLAVEAPAVIVLGERHGTNPDLSRAARIVYKLASRGPVTLGLESVHHENQAVLDDYADGKMEPGDMPGLMDWDTRWGFPWGPYQRLVTSAVHGAKVVGVGLDLGPRPEGETVPLPPGYMNILRDAMQGHDMPVEMESRFVQSMAWRDFAMTRRAIEAWDGEGHLVIVAGRGHIEGGKGIQWQAARMTDKPVHAFTLAWADPPCYPGDQVWKPGLLDLF